MILWFLFISFVFASPPQITENNARILWASEVNQNGEMELYLDVSKVPSGFISTNKTDYSVVIGSGEGKGTVLNVSDVSQSAPATHTILVFDEFLCVKHRGSKKTPEKRNGF